MIYLLTMEEIKKTKKRKKKKVTTNLTVALAKKIVTNATIGRKQSRREMMEDVGYSPTTARTYSTAVFRSESLHNALRDLGVDESRIAQTIQNGLGATLVAKDRETGSLSETTIPDHKARALYLSTLVDVTGLKKTTIETKNVNINIDLKDVLKDLGI